MYSFYQSTPSNKAQTPNLESDQEWKRMKRELDMDYQMKLKEVNDEAMQKLTSYREEHKMATQRMQ
jgi:hypothetical protein